MQKKCEIASGYNSALGGVQFNMASLNIATLGALHVTRDGTAVDGFAYNKVRALLIYLATDSARSHTRSELCGLLWPELLDRAARRNLSQALTTLRRALGDGSEPTPFVTIAGEAISIGPEVETDAGRFEALLTECERHRHRSWQTCASCGERLEAAMRLYRGDFLDRFFLADSAPFEEWALLWRERLRQRAFTALERLAQQAEWRADYHAAAEWASRLVALDPLREPSHRERMRLLALGGQWTAAEVQADQLRRLLRSELAVEPEPETLALVSAIRRRNLQDLRRLEPPVSRIPQAPTPLIGRLSDLTGLCGRLRADDVRLLTLVGSPGVGKTRLALEVATALTHDFEHGVRFVELAGIGDPADVVGALADSLELKEQSGKPLSETVINRLSPLHLLLVLDNFEHVLTAAPFIAQLLAACPFLKVLVTSRAPLRIRSEHECAIAPLPSAEAVALFVARVRAGEPGFQLTDENRPVVTELCARVDHLPLAIELIAGRAPGATPVELLRLLEQRLSALDSGPRDLPTRQQTLRAAIAWSYERLGPTEQHVFAHLGLFAGGCSQEAAQAVTNAGEPISEALGTLGRASLIQILSVAGATRYSLLETVREFALEQLEATHAGPAARVRHCDFFTDWAERVRPPLTGPQDRAFDQIDREHDNLRAALAFALENGRGLRLAVAVTDYWAIRGHLSEGRRWLSQALAIELQAAPALRAAALSAAGKLATRQGDYPTARALFEQAIALFKVLGDGPALSRAVRSLGIVADNEGNSELARLQYQESLDLSRECADPRGVAAALTNLGLLAAEAGDAAGARRLYEEGLGRASEIGDRGIMGNALLNLGLLADDAGQTAEAHTRLEESLARFREIGDQWSIALVLMNLGDLHLSADDDALAEPRLRESLALHRQLGDLATASYPTFGLGQIALKRGDAGLARRLMSQSLTWRYEAREMRPIAHNLEKLARLDRLEGRFERAARLLGAAAAARVTVQVALKARALQDVADDVATLRRQLGAARYAECWEEGQALTLDQAVALALAPAPALAGPRSA